MNARESALREWWWWKEHTPKDIAVNSSAETMILTLIAKSFFEDLAEVNCSNFVDTCTVRWHGNGERNIFGARVGEMQSDELESILTHPGGQMQRDPQAGAKTAVAQRVQLVAASRACPCAPPL